MQPNDPDNRPSDLNASTVSGCGRPSMVLYYNPKTGQRHLDEFIWGLLPHDNPDPNTAVRPISASAETVATHPLFAAAFRDRRAIIPMSVYYHRGWTRGSKAVFAISRRDGEPMAIAGLWEAFRWPDGTITRTYCIITAEAKSLISPIQDRMLVVLEKADWPLWLGEQPGNPTRLLRPPESDILECKLTNEGRPRPQRRLF
ncbi:MAG TPA: SOS response-associated peptidase [Acetobacteraceae bacterium]|jgi:putative SOS response-associated peptidase YedK|nr:SOS response-associated peptidase [Acetobacteraceae bacterium]